MSFKREKYCCYWDRCNHVRLVCGSVYARPHSVYTRVRVYMFLFVSPFRMQDDDARALLWQRCGVRVVYVYVWACVYFKG